MLEIRKSSSFYLVSYLHYLLCFVKLLGYYYISRLNVSLKLRYFCRQQQSRFPSLHKCFAYLKIISILKLITQVLPSISMLQVCFSACSLQSLLCMHSCVFKKSVSLLCVLSKTIPNFLIVFPFYNS